MTATLDLPPLHAPFAGGDPRDALKDARGCSVDSCARSTEKGAHGLCGVHYARRRRGAPLGGAALLRDPARTVAERVYPRLQLDDTTGCWLWTGALRNGYGAVGVGRRVLYVHRWVFEDLITEVPDGLVLDHLCVNRPCANPWHVEPVTLAVNNERGGDTRGTRKEAAA